MRKIGIFNFLKGAKKTMQNMKYAKMMNGYTPVFSQFGNDIYASDIVQNAISIICNDMSKLLPKHIIIDPKTGMQTVVNDELSRLLKFGPNPLMTTSDFIYKIVFQYEYNKNAWIYPTYNKIPLGNGKYKRYYTGLWPLNPTSVEFLEDTTGKLFVKFYFANGEPYILPYDDVIHWRKDYSLNDFMGGDENGNPNNKGLLKLLSANDTILQGIEKGIKSSFAIKGIVKINTMLDDEKQEEERRKFEEKLKNNTSGILTLDNKNDYIPLKADPKFIDKDTMEFIDNRILANYGVSRAIFNGDFTEEQYQSHYEKNLEPMVISLGRAFTKTLFTNRQLEIGHEIIFYQQGLMYMNTTNKINAIDIMSRIGTLSDNQVLAAFGYPPIEGGDVRKQSLNYINREIADQYQLMNSVSKGKGEKNEQS